MTDRRASSSGRSASSGRPSSERRGCRSRPSRRSGCRGRIELDAALAEGLADLDGFSHLILLYHLHRVDRAAAHGDAVPRRRPHGRLRDPLAGPAEPDRPLDGPARRRLAARRSRSRTSTWSTARRCSTSSPTCRPSTTARTCADRLVRGPSGGLAKARADDRFAPGAGSPETDEHSQSRRIARTIRPGRRPRG